MEIKNIIFDFGGVIINIHHSKVENAFKELGISQFEKLYSKATQSDIFQKFETGILSPNDFRDSLRSIIGKKISDKKLDFAWNQIIGNYPPHRINLLLELKKNYNVYLLSNTNTIHYNFYIQNFKNEFGFEFSSLFNKAYWSFKIGDRKPNYSIFSLVLKDSNLVAQETLFIDDSLQNIKAARQLGFQTYHLNKDTDLSDIFLNGKSIL